jgi:sterol desaturase/sphingolipid hydroxylase (fatty acid hydroxylase superfamily)
MTLEILSPCVIIVWALVLTVAERAFPYIPGYRVVRPDFWNDLMMYSLFQSSVLAIVIASIIRWADEASHLSRFHLVSDFPLWLQLAFFLITHDLWQYWFHRFQHRNRLLWRTHEAAHAPLHVDWLAGSRSHALEILIAQTIEFAPIFLLGAAPEIPLLKGMIDAVWGMFNHSNIRVRMGWLLYVFNGPELHRWHHDLRAPRGGVNLATKFALWDWLWGTAYLPADIPAGQYGLRNSAEFPHGNYFKQFTFAFRKDTRRAAGNAWGNSPTRMPGKL